MKHRHGYSGLPAHANWRLAVAERPSAQVDPVVDFPFKVRVRDRVATAGSCFAQHIARYLGECGMNYFVAEPAHPMIPPVLARDFNYGTFSARYGNLYTPRQLLQLFERAYGRFEPADSAWQEDNGRWLDPYRPQVQPTGFASRRELDLDRGLHLAAVRRMFEQLDVFVFTLGLTEAWLSTVDGAVYPTCPGAAGGRFDPVLHRFHNFTVDEITADLQAFIDALRAVNPAAKVMLTVSPVPLIATASGQHVLAATTYSKSVLRVACEQVCQQRPAVGYFPSYEVITGSYTRGSYFEPDMRSVTEAGVQHVMRLFMWHCVDADSEPLDAPPASKAAKQMAENQRLLELMCDEEVLDRRPPASA